MIENVCIIGDIHGTLNEFKELLSIIHSKYEKIRIILTGDLIDRGPDSVGVVRLARDLNLECVMGNHEHAFLKWFRNQGTSVDIYTPKDYYHKFSDEDIQYIANMPTYIELDDLIVVHAGLKPGISLSNQKKEDLMYLRYTDSDRKFISLKKINKIGKEKSGALFWTEFGPFDKSIAYGHNVHSFENIKIDEYENGTACYGLDTGCCFGGKLSALIWNTKEIVQVQAKQVYYQSKLEIQ